MVDWVIPDGYPRKQLPAGTTLIREGDFGEVMYLVVKGQLQVSKQVIEGAEKILSLLDVGQYVGELGLLTEAQRSATVRAVVDSEVIEIDQQAFLQLMQDNPRMALDLMRQMAHRLEQTTEQFILLGLELALARRKPTPVQQGFSRMRFVATGSFAGHQTAEVMRIAAGEAQASRNPALVASLVRPGRVQDALVYIIETENPQDILQLIQPFTGLVQWDICPAIEAQEGLTAVVSPPAEGFSSDLTRQ